MAESQKNCLRTNTWGRFVLGVFVVAWMNVAAQPCLMAMELAPDQTVMSGHMEHGEHATGHDCGHCPPGADHQGNHCANALTADCGDVPDYSVDGRAGKLEAKDLSQATVFVELPPVPGFHFEAVPPPFHDCDRLKHEPGPRLNVLNCVFLK